MEMQRLFLALTFSDHIVSAIEQSLAPLKECNPELHWLPTEKWHLTLHFFGKCDLLAFSALDSELQQNFSQFNLSQGQLQADSTLYLPSVLEARVIAYRIRKTDFLQELIHITNHAIYSAGYQTKRSFLPHISAAQVKNSLPLIDLPLPSELLQVHSITLFNSVASSAGNCYQTIKTYRTI